MHLLIKTLFVLCLSISLIAFIETAWSAIRKPKTFLSRFENKTGFISLPNVWLIFALIGYIAMTACGFHGLLFWIPESWGTIGEDGQFFSLRSSATILLTMSTLPGILIFEKYAHMHIKAKSLEDTIFGVEKIINNADNLNSLFDSNELRNSKDADIVWLYKQAEDLRRKISQMQNLNSRK